MVATAASTIHHFTGNNIGPKGDTTSRSLVVRLEVDRTDPENRSFNTTIQSDGPKHIAGKS